MNQIYVFIIRNDVWIGILCVMGIIWYGMQFIRAQQTLRRAMFGLEIERGSQMRNSAAVILLALGLVLASIYYVNTTVAPQLPAELLLPPTPTPDIFSTPLSSPTPLGTAVAAQPTPTFEFAPTVTLPGAIPGTGDTLTDPTSPDLADERIVPTPFIGCTPELTISDPREGSTVAGTILFLGTVDTPNFGFYTLEANGPETGGQWASLLGRNIDQRVLEGGFIANANLSQWARGPYLFRLTAVDALGNETGQCVIQLTLNN